MKLEMLISLGGVWCFLGAVSCGGTTASEVPPLDGVSSDGSGGYPVVSAGGASPSLEEAFEAEDPYLEPDCPDAPPPPVDNECDPFDAWAQCPSGEGCYPFLEYPYGERCGYAAYGAICLPASEGGQGDFCGEYVGYCEPGFMCVVGAVGGKRCGQICEPGADHDCPAGLICGETDVKGFGVCF